MPRNSDRQLNAVMDIDITAANKKLVEIEKRGNETVRRVSQNGKLISETLTRVSGATVSGAIQANTAWTALMSSYTVAIGTIGLVTGAVKGLTASLTGLAQATWEDEASTKARNAAVLSLKGASDELISSLDAQVDKYQRLYGVSDTATRSIQQQLAEYRLAPALIERATAAITAQGISAVALTKFLEGATSKIKGTSIAVEDNATQQERLQAVIEGTKGSFAALEAAADSGKGAADRFREGWGELTEALGSAFNTEGFKSTVNNMAEALFGLAEIARNVIRNLNNKELLPALAQIAKNSSWTDWLNIGAGLGMSAFGTSGMGLITQGLGNMAGNAAGDPAALAAMSAWEKEDARLKALLANTGGSGGGALLANTGGSGGGDVDSSGSGPGGTEKVKKAAKEKASAMVAGWRSGLSGMSKYDQKVLEFFVFGNMKDIPAGWINADRAIPGVSAGGNGRPFGMSIAALAAGMIPSGRSLNDLSLNGYDPYKADQPFTALDPAIVRGGLRKLLAEGGQESLLNAAISGGGGGLANAAGGLLGQAATAGIGGFLGMAGGPLGAVLGGGLFKGLGKLFGGGHSDVNRGSTPGKPVYTVAKISNVDELARAGNVSRSLMIGGASNNVNWAMNQLNYAAAGGQ